MVSLQCIDRMALAAMSATTLVVAVAATMLSPDAHAARTPSVTVTRTVAAVNDDTIMRIAPGMMSSEVLALIGPPYARARFEATKTTAWDYHYAGIWSNSSDFSVILDDDGVVVARILTRNGE